MVHVFGEKAASCPCKQIKQALGTLISWPVALESKIVAKIADTIRNKMR